MDYLIQVNNLNLRKYVKVIEPFVNKIKAVKFRYYFIILLTVYLINVNRKKIYTKIEQGNEKLIDILDNEPLCD